MLTYERLDCDAGHVLDWKPDDIDKGIKTAGNICGEVDGGAAVWGGYGEASSVQSFFQFAHDSPLVLACGAESLRNDSGSVCVDLFEGGKD